MSFQIYRAGRWRTISGLKVYANGAWRTILTLKVYKSGAWRTVGNFTAPRSGGGGGTTTTTSPVTLAITPGTFTAISHGAGLATKLLTATPTGGKSPYSYAWSFTYNSGGVTLSSTSLASVTVYGPDDAHCTVKCVCTDSLGSTDDATSTGTFAVLDLNNTQ